MFLSGEQQIPVSEFSPNELVDVDTRVDVADGLLAWGLFRPLCYQRCMTGWSRT